MSLQEPRSSASQTPPHGIIPKSPQEGTLGPSPVLAQLATNIGALPTAHMQPIMHVGSRRMALSRCPHPNTWHLVYGADGVKSLCRCDYDDGLRGEVVQVGPRPAHASLQSQNLSQRCSAGWKEGGESERCPVAACEMEDRPEAEEFRGLWELEKTRNLMSPWRLRETSALQPCPHLDVSPERSVSDL